MANQYIKILGDASPVDIHHTSDLTGKQGTAVLVAGAGGGYAGYKLWKKHPVLGAFAGLAAGGNAASLATGVHDAHKDAVRSALSTGGLVLGSLKWKKHPGWGGFLGAIAGGLLSSFIPGQSE